MKTSEDIKQVMGAIQAVQQNAGAIQKTTKGQVGSREYRYANLNDTWDTIKDLMAANKLVVTQSPTTGAGQMGEFFSTTIYHIESGEYISETMQMVLSRNDPQAIGAAITYYRRYMLTSMLGLIPDDDNDAREQRLATVQQKAQIVGAIKRIYPELKKPNEIVEAIQGIIGKAPGNIREDEAKGALDMINAFGDKQSGVDQTNE